MKRGNRIDNIENLWVKTNEGITKNRIRPPENIDSNPLLDLSLFDDSRLYRPMQGRVWRMLPVETHRGCPYQCSYCNSPSQLKLYKQECNSRFFRKKSFSAIHKELKYYREVMKAEAFYFWADTFMAYSDSEFQQFCEIYQDIRLPFWCQSRPEEIKKERIHKLMKLGLFRMGIGIEHGNEKFRSEILRRNVSNKTIIENLRILNECDLKFSVNNIIGFPTETRELAMDTIELNRHISADSANAYSFSPFHGTPLRKMAEEMGYCNKNLIARSVTKPTMLNMNQFPPDEIEGLRRCFILYVNMPKKRWAEIRQAENMTLEGNLLFNQLKEDCSLNYMKWDLS